MSKTRRGLSFVLCLVMVFSLFAGMPFEVLDFGTEANAKAYTNEGTITAWYTAMTDLNGEKTKTALVDKYFDWLFASNSTFRSRIQVSAGGTTFRVKLTNYYGAEDIKVNGMNVGLPSGGNATAVDKNTVVNVTYKGSTSFTIPKGDSIWSDWFTVNKTVSSGGYLVFSTYVKNSGMVRDAGLTGSISYCWRNNQLTNYEWSYGAAGKLSQQDDKVGDYNLTPLLNCIEVETSNTQAYNTVIIGDSTVTNNIPSLLQSRLSSNGVSQVAVIGAGIKGNELLGDGKGPDGPLEGNALLKRFDMDALSLTGVKKVFVKIGVNDIVHPNCSNLSEYYPDGTPTAQAIIDGYKQLIRAAHAKNIEIYFFDISPWIGYTREGTVTTDETTIAAMESVRLEVNKWLKENATYNVDDDCMTIDPIVNDSFGLVITSDAIGVERNGQQVLKDAYTTDNIHYTSSGQSVVTNQIPISIFKGVPTGDTHKKVGNLFIATTRTNGGGWYFFGSDENLPANSTDQQGEIKLMATDGTETADIGLNWDRRGAYYGNPVNDIELQATTLQKGTKGAPYFAVESVPLNAADDENSSSSITVPVDQKYRAAYWQQTTDKSSEIRWKNNVYPDLYLAWYYPAATIPKVLDTGVRNLDDVLVSGFAQSKWYSFNTIGSYNTSLSYKSLVYYGSIGPTELTKDDKYLSFIDHTADSTKGEDVKNGFSFRGVAESYKKYNGSDSGNLVTLYASGSVDTYLAISKASKDQIFYMGENGTKVGFDYTLTDTLLNSPTMTSTGDNVNSLNSITDSFKTYDKFVGYTYGNSADRSVSFTSDDENVATVDTDGNIVLTGKPGTANVTMTVTWKELDGTEYTMTDTATVTNVFYTADICIDGDCPDAYEFTNNTGNGTKIVSVSYTSNPSSKPLPEGGEWKWISSDDSIFTVNGSGESATLGFTKKNGTATLTAAYVKDGITYCSDSVMVTNVTASVDIQIGDDTPENGAYPDYKAIDGIAKDDTLKLTAQSVGVGKDTLDMDTGKYAWSIVDENHSGVTITDENARAATLTFDGVDASVAIKLTYTLDGKIYESFVFVTVTVGVAESNTIIDFGLPVKLDLNASGISKDAPQGVKLVTDRTADNKYDADDVDLSFGTASLADGTVTYTPTKIATAIDTLYYSKHVTNGFKYANVNIIPASSVYYEDTAVGDDGNGFVTYSKDAAGNSHWDVAGTPNNNASVKDDVYGYDEAYGNYTTYSNSSSHFVTVSPTFGANGNKDKIYPTATFEFTGKGFAVYSTSDNDAGYVGVEVKKVDEATGEKTTVYSRFLNAYATGDYDQTPTIQVFLDEYGKYEVKISVAYDKVFDRNSDGKYTYYLDAIRIYNPLDNNDDAKNAYAEVGEANAEFTTIRSKLISAESFGQITDETPGAVFLDGGTAEATVADYKNNGPKNEVYLAKGQGVAFDVEGLDKLDKVELGIKLAGKPSDNENDEVTINGDKIAITSATDMYYNIKDAAARNDGKVVVANTGEGLISLTVLKTTSKDNVAQSITVYPSLGDFAAAEIMSYVMPTEPDPTVEPTVEPTEEPQPSEDPEPTADPQPSEDPQPDDGQDQGSVINKIVKKIGDFFKKLFGGWKR